MSPPEKRKFTRRRFLKNSGYVVGGVLGGGILTEVISKQFRTNAPADEETNEKLTHALTYFTKKEDFNVLAQVTELIFPEDESGPGAIALGVPFYIDKQLSSAWGYNARDYMQGPFYKGEPTQGYQTSMLRHEIFSAGIEKIKEYSEATFNRPFLELEEEEQISVLKAFENDEVEMKGVMSSQFFALLRGATLEGVYADPLYGGNEQMNGWKMKKYPGNKMSYLEVIDSEEFYDEPPSSLHAHMEDSSNER
ncbi:gluconate 2-dehydrogenase subunit 3 family protein [Aliibacillus thermotolerans]|uniref:Gluconate 2-dehydrogenase subunit 3 family protein n=1 Tax=Aliibacillus thermotolerans TaxID=1834418 RepID=A0ABW0U296_9BACI|nr:gluconate 2-dehydrogenase subunit 3 family protein [Aliibacillus thermotolerans]MDA3128710.1 gluconate 2-dehydrogenase subunit 3 family protein [Aliibacillus thermotolerans]